MKRKDIILLAGILLAAAILWGCFSLFFPGKQGGYAEIQVGSEIIERIPMSEPCRKIIAGTGGTNTLVIEGGIARIEEADCPDRLCVRQGGISKNGQSIICLPHQLVVRIVEEAEE
ncbi:NusG domain II-containing protein [Cuneatibacter caecimuris]|uniref:Uncharacterized protein n=1 Tax=Cuneatibacter caecimuris TaxID=1796618 RepID=A0A4Q7NZS8_9FIRM|nr:NusG domain II-containing protein [Cuneatibacter caecimuris]RZS93016.1 hypothetical protein EV209_2762 [Cuneatibacter caecimuris]